MSFSKILNSEYTLVNVLSSRNKHQLLHMRNSLGKDIVVRVFTDEIDTSVFERLCGIRHRNLAEIYDVITENDKTYVVEQFIRGTSLADFDSLDEAGCVRAVTEICQGLLALHSMGIIHRDVKEDNVIIADDGTIKLVDFGISKIFKPQQERDTTLLGTATYAPPEQYGLSQTGFSSDIYSLGILANILVTGKHPTLKLYEKGKLGRFIKRATNISVEKRFSSVTQVIDLLG